MNLSEGANLSVGDVIQLESAPGRYIRVDALDADGRITKMSSYKDAGCKVPYRAKPLKPTPAEIIENARKRLNARRTVTR
jgi:hypothetical protein